MSEQVFCRRCGQPIKQKRGDKLFCSDKCAAAWAREQGYYRERFHAEKPECIKKNCEYCNTIFEYNEYAMRTGQRVPKFCSNKCRQAAYRERKAQEGKTAGYTGNWDDGRNDKTETKGTSQGKKKQSGKGTSQDDGGAKERYEKWQDERRKGTSQEQENKGTSQGEAAKGTQQPPIDKRWKSKDAYEILGVTYLTPINEIKKIWKRLLRTYHPDISKDPNAGEICKKINWAWDRIENAGSRTNRR